MAGSREEQADARSLILLDRAPLIEEALCACERACRAIEELKSQLHRHESLDLPAYERWYQKSFARHALEARDALDAIGEKEEQLASVRKRHWDRFFESSCEHHSEGSLGRDGDEDHDEDLSHGSGSARSWQAWRSAADADESDDPGAEEYRYQEDGGMYDDEQDHHYSEDEEASRRFERLFRRGTERGGGFHHRRARDEGERRYTGSKDHDRRRSEPAGAAVHDQPSLLSRLKERYRMVVKKLHPDLNPDLSAERKGLWNQAQAAYQKQDLEQLDLVIALSEAFEGEVSDSTSVHQLRHAAREIARFIGPLRVKLELARKSRAWNFSLADDRDRIRREVEAELRKEAARLRQRIEHLDAEIRKFTRAGSTADRGSADHAPTVF